MKRNLLPTILGLAMMLIPGMLQADTIMLEDFEDSTITYTTNLADALDDIGSFDYYGRLAPDTVLPAGGASAPAVNYSNLQGSGYYGAQDTDSAQGGGGATPGNDLVELNWTVNTSNYENLSLSWFIAEDDSGDGNEDWDTNSSFRVAVQLDGGGFTEIFVVEGSDDGTGTGGTTNATPRIDTNNDGIGDGTEITDTFTQFSQALANANTVDIRIQIFEMNAGDEDVAFDNVHLEGDLVAVPEPGAAMMLTVAMAGLFFRRRSA